MEAIEGTKFKDRPTKQGGSDYLLLNKAIKEWLGLNENKEIVISFEKKKKGNFIALWAE